MSSEIKEAFAHPAERAASMALEGVHDRLSLRDHVVAVEIGAFQAERDMTQRISFDVVVEVRAPEADPGDDVDQILSYDRITWAIGHELEAERLNLLETLAERVADRILAEPQALRVFVRIQKLDKGNGALGVEIVRALDEAAPAEVEPTPQPTVAYFSNAAAESENFRSWLEQLTAKEAPLILCVDLPDAPRPKAATPQAQRHIDLLAIEQNGWRLAAREAGLAVVGTRTELDWAMKNNLPAIWAPSKLVLDALKMPPRDPLGLAAWFAGEWQANCLYIFGEELPAFYHGSAHTVSLREPTI